MEKNFDLKFKNLILLSKNTFKKYKVHFEKF